jgi:hypothetical protein
MKLWESELISPWRELISETDENCPRKFRSNERIDHGCHPEIIALLVQRKDCAFHGRAKEAAHFVEAQTALRPRIALLLGAAFDSIANQLTDATTVRYETIPHFPRADSSSHAGRLVIGKLADVSLAVLCGRVHYYEGLGLDAVVFPIRMLARMGICSLVNLCCWWRKSGVYARQPRCSLRPHQSAREQSDDRPAGRTTRLSIRGYERSV